MLISCNNLFMSCITGCITDYNIYTKGVPLIEVLNYTRLHGIRDILILLQFKKKNTISPLFDFLKTEYLLVVYNDLSISLSLIFLLLFSFFFFHNYYA